MKTDNSNDQLLDIFNPEDVIRIMRERGKSITFEEAKDILNFLQRAEQLTQNQQFFHTGPESLN